MAAVAVAMEEGESWEEGRRGGLDEGVMVKRGVVERMRGSGRSGKREVGRHGGEADGRGWARRGGSHEGGGGGRRRQGQEGRGVEDGGRGAGGGRGGDRAAAGRRALLPAARVRRRAQLGPDDGAVRAEGRTAAGGAAVAGAGGGEGDGTIGGLLSMMSSAGLRPWPSLGFPSLLPSYLLPPSLLSSSPPLYFLLDLVRQPWVHLADATTGTAAYGRRRRSFSFPLPSSSSSSSSFPWFISPLSPSGFLLPLRLLLLLDFL